MNTSATPLPVALTDFTIPDRDDPSQGFTIVPVKINEFPLGPIMRTNTDAMFAATTTARIAELGKDGMIVSANGGRWRADVFLFRGNNPDTLTWKIAGQLGTVNAPLYRAPSLPFPTPIPCG